MIFARDIARRGGSKGMSSSRPAVTALAMSLLVALVACGGASASSTAGSVAATAGEAGGGSAGAAPSASSRVAPRNADITPEGRVEACRVAAEACANHGVAWDVEGTIGCMPDDVVAMAGRDQLAEGMHETKKRADEVGVRFERITVERPSQMAKQDGAGPRGTARTFAVVPKTLVMRTPKGTVESKSYLLGVSDDDGRTWKFVEGVTLDASNIHELFPRFPSSIDLPKRELKPRAASK